MKVVVTAVLVSAFALTACSPSSQPVPRPYKGENFWSTHCKSSNSSKSASTSRPPPDAETLDQIKARRHREVVEAQARDSNQTEAQKQASAAEDAETAKAAEEYAAQQKHDDEVWLQNPNWSAACAGVVIATYESKLEHVEIATKNTHVGSSGLFDVLVFRDLGAPPAVGAPRTTTSNLVYRAAITDVDTGRILRAIDTTGIWSERATAGTTPGTGTDFRALETSDPKTLLRMDANMSCEGMDCVMLWRYRRLHVIGFDSVSGLPVLAGSVEIAVSNKLASATCAVILCVLAYFIAAVATFGAHKRQRFYDENGEANGAGIRTVNAAPDLSAPKVRGDPKNRGLLDSLRPTPQHRLNKGHGWLKGTNYQSLISHLDPVILTAGPNGLGSATNLQILFFSIIVFGVVAYIWMAAGYLTALSSTVVTLMGISGIGATAASGADLKTRLSFDSWAWLIERHWLPPGGIAEVNVAQWKDIFTTGGSFDVYRFQMVSFSFVVGLSLITVGAQAADLSSFTVPDALLGILGLSQAVYVAGKLVAPPTIAELDAQIVVLEKAEKDLKEANAIARAGVADLTKISWLPNPDLVAAQKALVDYNALWEKTRIMFESTIGRLLHDDAIKHPPFDLSDVVRNRLPDARIWTDYRQILTLVDAPPAGYQWRVDSGLWPTAMKLDNSGSPAAVTISVPGSSLTEMTTYRFSLRAFDPAGNRSVVKDFELNVVQGAGGGMAPETSPAPAPVAGPAPLDGGVVVAAPSTVAEVVPAAAPTTADGSVPVTGPGTAENAVPVAGADLAGGAATVAGPEAAEGAAPVVVPEAAEGAEVIAGSDAAAGAGAVVDPAVTSMPLLSEMPAPPLDEDGTEPPAKEPAAGNAGASGGKEPNT